MADIRISHTAGLDAGTRTAVRALLDDVFGGLSDDDWEHALGGVHALAWEGGDVVGHASVIQRRLLHGGRALRTGYVEGVAVRADARRRGLGRSLMDALDSVIRGAYELGALSSSEEASGFYARLGWTRWRGPTSALTPSGIVRTEVEDGGVYVRAESAPLDVDAELTCDWRDGDVW